MTYTMSIDDGFRKGDLLSIKCMVEYDSQAGGKLLTVSRLNRHGDKVNFDIDRGQIDRRLPRPLPDEPNRDSILKGQTGALFTWKTDGWQSFSGGYRMTWCQRFYDDNGPFHVYSADQEL